MSTMLAAVDPGDEVIIFEPFYENYGPDATLSGAVPRFVTLRAPDWEFDPDELAAAFNNRTKAIIINTPNNPTGAVIPGPMLKELVDLVRSRGVFTLFDECYDFFVYGEKSHVSAASLVGPSDDFFAILGAVSKTYSMTGWRIGMAAGNAEMIDALMRVKSNLDSGTPQAIQEMGISALELPESWISSNNEIYRRRRDMVVDSLKAIGLDPISPKAGLYVWTNVPEGFSSAQFAQLLLDDRDIVVTPGSGYGRQGEGYIRLSLTTPDDRIEEGLGRLKGWKIPPIARTG